MPWRARRAEGPFAAVLKPARPSTCSLPKSASAFAGHAQPRQPRAGAEDTYCVPLQSGRSVVPKRRPLRPPDASTGGTPSWLCQAMLSSRSGTTSSRPRRASIWNGTPGNTCRSGCELRPEMREQGFDALALAEGSGRPELEAAVGDIERAIAQSGCGVGRPTTLVYNLAYQLGAPDLSQNGAQI
jgi:hypothetical protein